MNFAGRVLRLFGWKVSVTVPDVAKCIICVAPHTSNWDFIVGKLAYLSVGRDAGFLMKSGWFFWPLGCFFRAIGGIPVERRRKGVSLTQSIVEKFKSAERLQLAITPEGTRSLQHNWHTGFLHIAHEAGVPVMLGVIDFHKKEVRVDDEFIPSGDIEKDLRAVKEFYRGAQGRYPHKFTVD